MLVYAYKLYDTLETDEAKKDFEYKLKLIQEKYR